MDKTHLSASYDVDLAKRVGVNAAALFNKLSYLSRCTTRPDGFCWRTSGELEDELGLSIKQQRIAIKKLEDAGIIETKNTYIINTKKKCKHFRILPDWSNRANLIVTKGQNQKEPKGTDQIVTKGEDLYLKEYPKEYSNSSNHTQNKKESVSDDMMELIRDFCKEHGDDKTEELLLNWLEIRRAKKVVETAGSVAANLEILPGMAGDSGMNINDYLSYTIRKGWKDLYPRNESGNTVRRKTGKEAGITVPDSLPVDPESDFTTSDLEAGDDPILSMFQDEDDM